MSVCFKDTHTHTRTLAFVVRGQAMDAVTQQPPVPGTKRPHDGSAPTDRDHQHKKQKKDNKHKKEKKKHKKDKKDCAAQKTAGTGQPALSLHSSPAATPPRSTSAPSNAGTPGSPSPPPPGNASTAAAAHAHWEATQPHRRRCQATQLQPHQLAKLPRPRPQPRCQTMQLRHQAMQLRHQAMQLRRRSALQR